MRSRSWFPARSYGLWLLVLLCTVLALWLEGPGRPGRERVFALAGLSHDGLAAGFWWTWLSYGLLHGSWWHAGLNLLSLAVVGWQIAREWGQAAMLAVVAAGTVAGGLVQMAMVSDGLLIGLSGGIFALVVAATLHWDERIVYIGLGPVRLAHLRGRSLGRGLLIGALVLAVVAWLRPQWAGGIGHACHAGGAIAGFLAWWAGARLRSRRPAAATPQPGPGFFQQP
jgi:membrane associated rhomboid family serine protease